MKPLRLILNVVGFVLAPAFAAGAITFAVLDHVTKSNDRRAVSIADEVAVWLYDLTSPRSLP